MNDSKSSVEKSPENIETEVVKFGELKPGDFILDEDNNPVEVLSVTEKHIPDRMLK